MQVQARFPDQRGRRAGGKHGKRSGAGLVQQPQPAQTGTAVPDENEVQPRQIERQRQHIFQNRIAK